MLNNLRGEIVAKYRTVKNFAKTVHWSNRKAYDVLNGKQELTMMDMEEICDAIELEIPSEIRKLFFE